MGSAVRTRLIPAVMLLVVMAAIWWARRKPPQTFPTAYVSDRSAIVWNTMAQVRERVTDVKYGERVSVLSRSGDETEVRTGDGLQGWMDTQLLMAPDLWQRASELLTRARSMPVQAVGHTRAPSNIHLDASRTGTRVFQFGRNVHVVVLQRQAVAVPAPAGSTGASQTPAPATPEAAGNTAPEDGASGSGTEQQKQEDWLFVLHEPAPASAASNAADATAQTAAPDQLPPSGAAGPDLPIAGWVLARFVELDPPMTIADNASSAGLRVAAWETLNSVTDGTGTHPQYLLAGAHGGEGQPCDFTALRVYTWGSARARYETAYVENDLCGQFPIRASATPEGAEFRFRELDENGVERVYRMKQTIVRLVRDNEPPTAKKR
jgi:hypothetical protein